MKRENNNTTIKKQASHMLFVFFKCIQQHK